LTSHQQSRIAVALAASLVGLSGCWSSSPDEVVVYAALDREFSAPILMDFEEGEGVTVTPKYDVESTKTVGLANAIIQESKRPRCDVFWNNEILHTLRLEKLGLLEAYEPPSAEKYPAQYRSPDGRWHGFAARGRVLIVNTKLVPKEERPSSIRDLADPRWKDKCGLAKPLFGTTATHAAVLFATWGDDEAKHFFADVKDNAQVHSGNKQVALAVGRGQLSFGLTDTDDAIVEIESGSPVEIVYPDQGEGGMGALFIPNTLSILKNCPHPENARRLIDYLLTPAVEKTLAAGASAQFPLHADVSEPPRVAQQGVRHMEVDFEAAADKWDEASKYLEQLFATAE
jgi:iron(III) transport system substrate-binding protein